MNDDDIFKDGNEVHFENVDLKALLPDDLKTKVEVAELTQLVHDADTAGPLRLYIYDAQGYHSGGTWFQKVPQYPEEGEITTLEAMTKVAEAMASKREIRITNGADFLVFHAVDGEVIYPEGGTKAAFVKFWEPMI